MSNASYAAVMYARAAGARRQWAAVCAVGTLLASLGAGCDLENPSAVTYDTAEPRRLVMGAHHRWFGSEGIMTFYEFVASDEGVSAGGNPLIDAADLGDLAAVPVYQQQLVQLSQARELTRLAIERAKELGDATSLRHAQVYRGWFLIRMAERWGDQPIITGGPVLTQAEIQELAAEYFAEAAAIPPGLDPEAEEEFRTDSMRLRALAGIARVNWNLGHDPVDVNRLAAAIDAAREVLDLDSDFAFAAPPSNNNFKILIDLQTAFSSPEFAAIPFWWNDPSQPQGVKFIDHDELRLIEAGAHLLLGDLTTAKEAVRTTPLLLVNHVGLGRDRAFGDPPLTDAEVSALLDPLDAAGLATVIAELRRENQFGHGRRNVGPNGPIFPVPLPANAR